VTGVQTCALPISLMPELRPNRRRRIFPPKFPPPSRRRILAGKFRAPSPLRGRPTGGGAPVSHWMDEWLGGVQDLKMMMERKLFFELKEKHSFFSSYSKPTHSIKPNP
jgi:hypothetical protein